MIFYINHFSLIIFHHSVWLGFELFESLESRCIFIWCSYARDMTITICHNKPPDRKLGLSVDDFMPGRDGPENLSILKRRQLRLDH